MQSLRGLPVIVGVSGKSLEKRGAANAALCRVREWLHVEEVALVHVQGTDPPVPAQPMGLPEMRLGAMHRAKEGLLDPKATFGLGMENGLVCFGPDDWIDLATVIVLPRETRVPSVTTSIGIPCPAWAVKRSLACNRTRTAGSFLAEERGVPGTDWHRACLADVLGRADLLADAAYACLVLSYLGGLSRLM